MKTHLHLRSFLTAVAAFALATFVRAADTDTTEPDKSMTAAHECFLKKDMDGAAKHIHAAAAYMKKESEKVSASSKAEMKKAGEDLDKLGNDVKANRVKTDAELKQCFAKTDHCVANCWHKTAEDSKKAGQDTTAALKKAGAGLEGAAKWSGQELSKGTKAAVNGVKKAGEATAKGAKTAGDDVEKWFKGIGTGISQIGKKL